MKYKADRDEEEDGKEVEEDDEEAVRISRACKARDDPELREMRYLGRTAPVTALGSGGLKIATELVSRHAWF